MYKGITLFIFQLLALGLNVHAQKILLGIKAGPQYCMIYGNLAEEMEAKPRLGWHAGAYANFVLNKRLSLSTEISFSHKGYSRKYALGFDNTITGRDIFKLNYLDFPILLNVAVSPKFKISAGLMPALFINGKVVSLGKQYPIYWTYHSGISALAGVSYGIKKFDIGLRYAIDISMIIKQSYLPMMFFQSYLAYNINKK